MSVKKKKKKKTKLIDEMNNKKSGVENKNNKQKLRFPVELASEILKFTLDIQTFLNFSIASKYFYDYLKRDKSLMKLIKFKFNLSYISSISIKNFKRINLLKFILNLQRISQKNHQKSFIKKSSNLYLAILKSLKYKVILKFNI